MITDLNHEILSRLGGSWHEPSPTQAELRTKRLSAHLGEKDNIIEGREMQIAELPGQLVGNTGFDLKRQKQVADLSIQLTTMQQTL